MSRQRSTVLVTGARGFIGRALVDALRKEGHAVSGLDMAGDPSDPWAHRVNLLEGEATAAAMARLWPVDIMIHTAALAHGQNPPVGFTRGSVNASMTANLLRGLPAPVKKLIFLSSVDVYGGRAIREKGSLALNALVPDTDYGRDKLECEKAIHGCANAPDSDILRLTPVYDANHMADIRKRAFLPLLGRVKTKLWPEPFYSLTHLDTVVRVVTALARQPSAGIRTFDVSDREPYGQHTLCSWFSGPGLPVPTLLLEPIYLGMKLIPGTRGRSLRRMYTKLVRSNVYPCTADYELSAEVSDADESKPPRGLRGSENDPRG